MMESAMDVADLERDASTAHPEETTSQKLFSHLFEACNILRGPINQDEYKTYVIPILFFKRISDTYDEETEIAIKEYGDAKEKEISYELISEYGVPHDKTFLISIIIDGEKMGVGKGKNKKEAEHAAAKIALEKLKISVF